MKGKSGVVWVNEGGTGVGIVGEGGGGEIEVRCRLANK